MEHIGTSELSDLLLNVQIRSLYCPDLNIFYNLVVPRLFTLDASRNGRKLQQVIDEQWYHVKMDD